VTHPAFQRPLGSLLLISSLPLIVHGGSLNRASGATVLTKSSIIGLI